MTHPVAPDEDAERDRIVSERGCAGRSSGVERIDGFHRPREGRNGGGDPWHTNGRLAVVRVGAP